MSDPPSSDLALPTLASIASAGCTFCMPWTHDPIAITTGFESRQILSERGPWVLNSPFEPTEVRIQALVPELNGSSSSYKEASSTQDESSTEHLAVAGSISVSAPCLKAEVSGQYSKSVMENDNSIQSSRNASCRLGAIVLDRTPPFSKSAIKLLSYKDGPARFRKRYGDFYISGYSLGADAGACVSADTKGSSTSEMKQITVSVKVLFFKASATHTESSATSSSSASMTFSAYSTLDGVCEAKPFKMNTAGGQDALHGVVSQYMDKIQSLQKDVEERLAGLHLEDGQKLELRDGSRICQSGLVVQLILSPFARLEEYLVNASKATIHI